MLDTWISGQFDGNYDGALLNGHPDGLSLRSYTFAVREAVLSGVQPLESPPLPVDSSGLAPLRLPIVHNVHIIFCAADMQPRTLLADLHDFRLHAWGNASTEQVANGRPTLAGRFWGTAYARLSALAEQTLPAATPATATLVPAVVLDGSTLPPIAPVASTSLEPDEITTPAGLNPKRDRDSDVFASDGTLAAQNYQLQDTAPFVDAHTPLAGEARASGDQQTPGASAMRLQATEHIDSQPNEQGTQHDSSSDTALGAGPRTSESAPPAANSLQSEHVASAATSRQTDSKPQENNDPDRPSLSRGARSHVAPMHDPAGPTIASQYLKLRKRLWGEAPLLRPRWPVFLVILGLLFWMLCGWPVMLVSLGALLLQRALHLSLFKHRSWPSPRWQSWGHLLLLILPALWAFFAIIARSNSLQCTQPSWFPVGVLGLLLLMSAFARARVAAGIIALLWIGAMFIAFRDRGNTCGQSLSQSVIASVASTSAQITHKAEEIRSYDQDSDMVGKGSAKNQGDQRISLATALENPSRYFSCPQSASDTAVRPVDIYLGESALFGFNSDRLNAEAEANLGRLRTLIEFNPDASIVLTGHTDKLGVPLLNIKLSEQRAKRIAEWLVSHKVLPAERIDVRGAGDRDPVVDDPALYRMNRRVELHIDCPEAPFSPAASVAAPAASKP